MRSNILPGSDIWVICLQSFAFLLLLLVLGIGVTIPIPQAEGKTLVFKLVL